MFIQILIITILVLLIVCFVKILFTIFYKLYLSEFIIKYPMNDSDKRFLNLYSNETSLSDLFPENFNLFYTDTTWSTKNNNYIHDTINDKYYIIDYGYYYYLPNLKDFKITINNDKLKILLFDLKNKIKINNN